MGSMNPLNVAMIGTGEYSTGYVGGQQSGSDKKIGVVGLTFFDLRRRGKVGNLSMAGTNGTKFPAIRAHLQKNISDVYNGMDVSFGSYPGDEEKDTEAYKKAIDALSPGDAVAVFIPDPLHYPVALYAIERKIHVIITKPATQKISEAQHLLEASRTNNVFVFIEHHKRFDPVYADARHRATNGSLGDFNYFYSYMSQPKTQLDTFKAWIGTSDISYYLNSHHVDVCESMVPDYRPIRVTASASTGIASGLDIETEDTITLLVDWEKRDKSKRRATAVYTASWTAPKNAGLHSQQYFHAGFSQGEIRVNQAKRGYEVTEDEAGLVNYNPFYMKYAPDEEGNFAGQSGYGYVSIEKFIDGCRQLNEGRASIDDFDKRGLPTLKNTMATGAILEAGRISLDENRSVEILEVNGNWSLK